MLSLIIPESGHVTLNTADCEGWQVKDVFLPWYNAYRFLVQNAKRLDVEGLAPFKPLELTILQQSPNVLDRWINSASQSLVAFVRQEMEAYRLYTVSSFIIPFGHFLYLVMKD